RRGADELASLLNIVYEVLIAQVERAGAAIISFSGDAMLCWFARDNGAAALRCAAAIQAAMAGLELPPVSGVGSVSLAVKCAIVCGQAYRLRLGDGEIQYLDTLAGPALLDLAAIEQLARPGEIVVDRAIASRLPAPEIKEWRRLSDPELEGAVVEPAAAAPAAAAGGRQPAITMELVKPWLLPEVWARLERSGDEFITELRPAVAVFGRFAVPGELDPAAAADLDAYVRWVQASVARYEGVVLQLTIGEKGSFFYAAFGAPIAHENDAVRAVLVAHELLRPPEALALGHDLGIGISCGVMRTGAYGSASRRTYGVLGDHVNLAARLMQHAGPGELLASEDVRLAAAGLGDWQPLEPIKVKGKTTPVAIHRLGGLAARPELRPGAQAYRLPLLGRDAELERLIGLLDEAARGRGRVVSITGEAGIGKSRMVAALLEQARQRWQIAGGECQSHSTSTPYAVWKPICQTLFALDPADPPAEQARQLAAAISRVDPLWLRRMPLLGPLVNLDIPDNDLTRSFDPRLRNDSREALLVDWLRAWMGRQDPGRGLLLVLEDCHWMDLRSASLLGAISRVIKALPVALVVVGRDQDPSMAGLGARVEGLVEIRLAPLGEVAVSDLIAAKLDQFDRPPDPAAMPALVERVIGRTQGNPFYIEELLTYLHTRGEDLRDPALWDRADLPTSLHSLILSRIDQLAADQQQIVKVASIIGRLFRVAWLHGYYPSLGERPALAAALRRLDQAALTVLGAAEPDLVYLFKHVITRDVAYESLAFATRAALHERLAAYLEAAGVADDPQLLYQITHHYERSHNDAKKREYLRRAGAAAQAAYANEEAIGYYQRRLELADDDPARPDILLRLSEALDLVGETGQAQAICMEGLQLAHDLGQRQSRFDLRLQLIRLLQKTSGYQAALDLLRQVKADHPSEPDSALLLTEETILLWRMGDIAAAIDLARHLAGAKLKDNAIKAKALNTLGAITHAKGQPQESLDNYQKSRRLYKQLGDMKSLAVVLCNIGMATNTLKGQNRLYYFNQSHRLSLKIGHRYGQCIALGCSAYALREKGALKQARDHWRRALALARDIEHKHLIMMHAINLAAAYKDAKTHRRMRTELCEEALSLGREIGDLQGQSMALLNLANFYVDPPRILATLREALAICGRTQNISDCVTVLANLIGIIKSGSDLAGALRACATLLGYIHMLVESNQVEISSVIRDACDSCAADVRNSLDHAAFAAAWSAGQAMSLDEAIALAGSAAPQASPDPPNAPARVWL
ncbi:MAG TPA: AAA family ATPase, partial [Herpetosiphonaceae bacterium]|nr:AAA family ATPase [Herpetosiphonaceae bacterium]